MEYDLLLKQNIELRKRYIKNLSDWIREYIEESDYDMAQYTAETMVLELEHLEKDRNKYEQKQQEK